MEQWLDGTADYLSDIIISFRFLDLKMQDFHSSNRKTNGRWTKDQHLKFLQGLRIYGKNWKKIEAFIQTRTGSQIRSHAQKFFLKMHTQSSSEFDSQGFEDDPAEEGEEATVNSKTVSEGGVKHDDMSFFLGRIMQHYEGKKCLDFWKYLVDSKDATENSKAENKNDSFRRTVSLPEDVHEAFDPEPSNF